jgi:hypothetical protein
MTNPPCCLCRVRESAVLIGVDGAPAQYRDYVPVCAVCSEIVGDTVPPGLLHPNGEPKMKFTKDGDGYIVHDKDGRAVCRVKTMTTETLPPHKMPDGRVIPAEEADKPLPRDQWLFHFCAGRFTGAQLEEVLKSLPAE